jgi:hypothetical protein
MLVDLSSRSPKDLLRDKDGFSLERRVRQELDAKFGIRESAVTIHRLLAELPDKIPSLAERVFLDEALKCFRVGAFRAAIVMTWNLAYDHLCGVVVAKHLGEFNRQWPLSYPKDHAKARIAAISKLDDFGELKESQVIQICRSAGIVTNDVFKILEEKLGKRNTAAHPSLVEITQLEAESFINELVRNVVLKMI